MEVEHSNREQRWQALFTEHRFVNTVLVNRLSGDFLVVTGGNSPTIFVEHSLYVRPKA